MTSCVLCWVSSGAKQFDISKSSCLLKMYDAPFNIVVDEYDSSLRLMHT
jgi:hypothetical protein